MAKIPRITTKQKIILDREKKRLQEQVKKYLTNKKVPRITTKEKEKMEREKVGNVHNVNEEGIFRELPYVVGQNAKSYYLKASSQQQAEWDKQLREHMKNLKKKKKKADSGQTTLNLLK